MNNKVDYGVIVPIIQQHLSVDEGTAFDIFEDMEDSGIFSPYNIDSDISVLTSVTVNVLNTCNYSNWQAW